METLGGAATHKDRALEDAVKSSSNSMFRDFYIGQLKDNGDLEELTGVDSGYGNLRNLTTPREASDVEGILC
jgi:hypothetical protein